MDFLFAFFRFFSGFLGDDIGGHRDWSAGSTPIGAGSTPIGAGSTPIG